MQERSPRLGDGDVGPKNAGAVLALERDEMAAGVQHGDGERRAIRFASLAERDVDDGAGLPERDGHCCFPACERSQRNIMRIAGRQRWASVPGTAASVLASVRANRSEQT